MPKQHTSNSSNQQRYYQEIKSLSGKQDVYTKKRSAKPGEIRNTTEMIERKQMEQTFLQQTAKNGNNL
jgi:hypothetical protein